MDILLLSSGVSIIGAILALITLKSENVSKIVACTFGIVAAAMAIVAGAGGIFGESVLATYATPFAFANFTLLLNPLSGTLLVLINVLAVLAWIYGYSYFEEYKGGQIAAIGFFMNLFVAAMNMVIAVDNVFWFLVFFELMSLTSYFLVVVDQKGQSIKGGFLYLIMAHVGFLMIMVSYVIMAVVTGSLEFSDYRLYDFGAELGSIVFLLAFLGFGCKAGMFPFHSWLPQAHPAAPSNVSALMSGGMIKIGIFGIVKVGLDLLGSTECQLWWGIVVLVIGALSSVLGVAYALAVHDIKKLLAYSSVENIGIILLGVGVGFIGVATENLALASLGVLAGLYHLINHAMFKGLLFLGAGSVLFSTGTRNMEVLGGLYKAMPITAVCFLLGSLAISAIPPLNGFVSEWFTYQSLLTVAFEGDIALRCFAAFAVVSLAITGALAVTCFVKVYGVTFSGRCRSEAAKNAKEVPAAMTFAMIVLAVICVCLGVGAPWVAPIIEGVASSVLSTEANFVATNMTLVNFNNLGFVSPPLVAILLICCILLPLAIKTAIAGGGKANDRDPWACGYAIERGMAFTASTVGGQVQHFLKPLYSARRSISNAGGSVATFFNRFSGGAENLEGSSATLSDGLCSIVNWLGRLAQKIEHGNFRVYVIYVVVALVLFLALAVGMR